MRILLLTLMLSSLSLQMNLVTNVDLMSFPQTLVSKLPFNTFFPEPELHGLIPIKGDDDMFYWLFPSRSDPDKDPLVIWLSGGPGCSSSLAIFHENGPMTITNGEAALKDISWNNRANVVFVDNPIGTGYSNGSIIDVPKFEPEVASQFEEFLLGFYKKYPAFKDRELYVTGESYAGHYIPFVSAKILESQPLQDAGVNLAGVAIGNGLVSEYHQALGYSQFAYDNQMINVMGKTALDIGFKFCKLLIKYNIPYFNLMVCNYLTTAPLGNPLAPSYNVYDIRLKCEFPPLCYDFSDLDTYLNRDDVREALGVAGRKWESCNMKVHAAMIFDYMTDAEPKVIELLKAGKKVLVYNGDKDYICNWVGGHMWVNALDWEHKPQFNEQDNEDLGWAASQKYENFEFLRVYDAGHMVPMDQPESALKMLNRFIYDWKV